jgi:hypothetical protein
MSTCWRKCLYLGHQDVMKILFDAGANVWEEDDNALVNKKRHLNVV